MSATITNRFRTLSLGVVVLMLLFVFPVAVAAGEVTVEVEVVPVAEPLVDLSVVSWAECPSQPCLVGVTASGDIVWIDATTGRTSGRFESGLARRVSANVVLVGDELWGAWPPPWPDITYVPSPDYERPNMKDVAGTYQTYFIAAEIIVPVDGAAGGYVGGPQLFEPQFVHEYKGGVVSVAGTTNDRVEFWPDDGSGTDVYLVLERTILLDNPADEPIIGAVPGPDNGVIVAFDHDVILFGEDGKFVATLLSSRSNRGFAALDIDDCGSVYAAETGQGDLPLQVLKGVPSYKDPGCFVDSDGVFESDIVKMGRSGITLGCNPPINDRYCPDRRMTRGETAAFLARAFDL